MRQGATGEDKRQVGKQENVIEERKEAREGKLRGEEKHSGKAAEENAGDVLSPSFYFPPVSP